MTETISLIVAVAALALTAYQFTRTQAEARRTAAFTQIREIMSRVHAVRDFDRKSCEDEILEHYGGTAEPDGETESSLSVGAKEHLRLLDALELVAFALAKDVLDSTVVRPFLEDTFGRQAAGYIRFINELRRLLHDWSLYEYLYGILPTLIVPTPSWASHYDPPLEGPDAR